MASQKLDTLTVVIDANLKGFSAGLTRASSTLKRFGRDVGRIGRNMSLRISLPILAIGAASVKTASDVEEMRSKFDVVFGAAAKDVEKWTARTARALNRSKFDLQGYAAQIQDTFVPLGFARDKAAEMSKVVTELAVDLASFNNVAEGETVNLLTSALVGNSEAVRRFGIVITQATIKQELLNMGIQGGTLNATLQQKALATLNIILRGSADAQGDAARTAQSFANRLRGLQAQVKDLAVEIGVGLMPIAKQLITWAQDAISAFQALSPQTKAWVVAIAAAVAIVGPLLVSLGFISLGLGALAKGFALLATASRIAMLGVLKVVGGTVAALLSPIGLLVVAIATVGAAFLAFRNTVKTAFTGLGNAIKAALINNLVIPFRKAINALIDGLPDRLKKALGITKLEIPVEVEGSFGEALKAIGRKTKEQFEKDKTALSRGFDELKEKAKTVLGAILPSINLEGILSTFDEIQAGFQKVGEAGAAAASKFGEGMKEAGRLAADSVSKAIEQMIVDFRSLGSIIRSVGNIIQNEIVRQLVGIPIGKAAGNLVGSILGGSAGGGRAQPGVPINVGERGGEDLLGRGIFIPSVPSTIRNAADSRRMGGQSIVNHVTVTLAPGVSNVEAVVIQGAIQRSAQETFDAVFARLAGVSG